MTPMMRHAFSLSATGALCASLLLGCGSPKNVNQPSMPLTGYVKDDSGNAVANALVSNAAGTQKATTDASGHYAFAVPASDVGTGALSASAASFSTAFKIVPEQASEQDFVLRHFDTVTNVSLPTSPNAVATASATRADGKVTLNIPFGSLTTPSGAQATGEATVHLTYWHPIADVKQLPAPLVAHLPVRPDGTGPFDLALQTVGMVDIQITQGNDVLQVTPGQNLGLDQAVPAAIAAAMAQKPNDMADPYLFYFDTASSRWLLDGNIAWDSTTNTFHAQLPHMTIWNFDNFQNWNPPSSCSMSAIRDGGLGCGKPQSSNVGGCLAGTAINKAGSAYANSTVRLWLFDNEHISAIDVPTDASGTYCADIGTRLCVPAGGDTVKCDYSENTVAYLVSGTDSPDDSSMADPIPSNCQTSGGSYPAVSYVNNCGLIDDPDTGAKANTAPANTIATANIKVGTFCSNPSSCAQLPDTTISTTVPKKQPSNTPAEVCTVYLPQGSACTASKDPVSKKCCVVGTQCSDFVCVPTK